jgi:hypothetical protein
VGPEGLDVVADVTSILFSRLSWRYLRTCTYLMVIKPTPVRRPSRTQSCQKSGRRRRARPVTSMLCECADFLLATSSESRMSPGADRRDESSVEGPLGSSSSAGLWLAGDGERERCGK